MTRGGPPLRQEEVSMISYTISLDPAAAKLYEKVAQQTRLPVERILSDALFRLAGELSLSSLAKKA